MARTVRFLRNYASPSGSHHIGDLVTITGSDPVVPDAGTADALVTAGVVADITNIPAHTEVVPAAGTVVTVQEKRVQA
jgi:hypothetical protein